MITQSIQNKLERIAKHYAFHYGFDNQINKLIEECSELVTTQCQIDYLCKNAATLPKTKRKRKSCTPQKSVNWQTF